MEVSPRRCTNIKACWPCGHCGLQVSLQSVPSLGLLSAASMSSSSLLLLSSDEESVLASSSKAGIGTQARVFKGNVRLEVTAGDPNNIGLSEQELHLESLTPRVKWLPWGAAICNTLSQMWNVVTSVSKPCRA